jgi:hypothetical protein
VTENAMRITGHVFVFDSGQNRFIKRPSEQTRIFPVADSGNIVIVIPERVDVANSPMERLSRKPSC